MTSSCPTIRLTTTSEILAAPGDATLPNPGSGADNWRFETDRHQGSRRRIHQRTSMRLVTGIVVALAAGAAGAVWAQAQKAGVVPPGDWQTINRDFAATRYSPLNSDQHDERGQSEAGLVVPDAGRRHVRPACRERDHVHLERQPRDGDRWRERHGSLVVLHARRTRRRRCPPTQQAPRASRSAAPRRRCGWRSPGRSRGCARWWTRRRSCRLEVQGVAAAVAVAAWRRWPQVSARGLGYWPGDGKLAPRILFLTGNRLWAIDAQTGKVAEGFGENGSVAIGNGAGGVPSIYRNVAIVGASSTENPQEGNAIGNPRAFDVVTGKKLWEFQTVPKAGEKYQRHLGPQRLAEPPGDEHVGLCHADRCRARRCLSADRGPGGQLLRRRSTGQQRLRQLDRRRGSAQTGKYKLALPDRAPRSVGHRTADRRARSSMSTINGRRVAGHRARGQERATSSC